jgi:Ca2+/Na+ antiporter
MKNFGINLTWLTTVYVVVFAILCQTKLSFTGMIGMSFLGICLMLFLIYTVLHDEEYKTTKKFKDWYRDHPRKV